MLAFSLLGLMVLNSATRSIDGGTGITLKQVLSLIIGVVLALVLSLIDYKDLRIVGPFLYLGTTALLVYVLFKGFGEETTGAKSWMMIAGFSFQPSEVAKITFVIMAALFLDRLKEKSGRLNMLKLIVYSAIPIALVMAQNDTGTAMVFIFTFAVMVFIYGLPYKYFLAAGAAFVLSTPFLWKFALRPHQKKRILTYLFPESDPTDAGYQILHSKRTIGSGRLFGKGLYKGIQTQQGFVPVKESDFIFTVIGEELGFIGAVGVLLFIFFILLRCIHVARNSRDQFGSFLVTGLTGMLAFHFIENIGMTIGLLPIAGIPLPFVSAGGSAMISNYIAIGIVLSVSMRRKKTIFDSSQ